MFNVAIFACFVLANSVSSLPAAQNEAFIELQQAVLKLQLAAQAAAFKAEVGVKNSPLQEVGLSIEELIAYYGYPAETHEVVTEDGYILTLHRIPHGLNNTSEQNKPVALLMPGLLCNSAFFLVNGEKASLGFWLANRGYDVWVANYRGTTHSRRHLTLDPDEDKSSFWDYSFDEMGSYDLPAFIDYILTATNQEKLFYIGHSQGTTAFFAMAAQRPEYNDKIRLMVALAPVAYLSHTEHPILKVLAQNTDLIYWLATTINFYEILPHWDAITSIGSELCHDDAKTQELCVSIIRIIAGVNEKELNKTLIPLLTTHIPSGASVKQLMHFGQEILSGYFRKYDYGVIGNLAKYGKLSPPDYETDKITAPVALFYSINDVFAHIDDVSLLLEKLPNLVETFIVEDEEFSHLDFGLAIHADTLVYEKMLNVINKY